MAKKIEFELPEGYSLPDGVSTNGQFETLATLALKSNGKACLVAIDGYRMPGYTERDEDNGKTYAQASKDAMESEVGQSY